MLTAFTLAAALLAPAPAPALGPVTTVAAPAVHCQVPCGIYGDKLRVELLTEHAATIEKAMLQIEEIGASDKPNWNQLVRWITTKDEHAQAVQDQVSAYWLAQRIKAPSAAAGTPEHEAEQKKYLTQLVMAHQLTTSAMKCKQTTDVANVAAFRRSLAGLTGAYFSAEDLDHLKGHTEGAKDQEHEHAEGDHDHKEGEHK